jgi:hypothetical protein
LAKRSARKDDRLLVRDGRRSYRKSYSLTEVRLGLLVLVGLALVAAWVVWRGAHPDPALFEIPEELLEGEMPSADRGPLPNRLAAPGWTAGALVQFDTDNLYEKINGREDYYKAFGFQKLYFLSLVHEADAATTVDIELFDLGEAANALGAYSGERPPEVSPEVGESGMSHLAQNALFLTRGRYYLRAIGADVNDVVRAQLTHLREVFETGLDGEPLPWAYALFVGELDLDPSRVSYMRENAFSFGFASNVYAATLQDDQTEIFVVALFGEDAAPKLAQRFTAGFLEYGSVVENAPQGSGVQWIRDRYLEGISGATSVGSWVTGVRSAPDVETAAAALQSLQDGVQALPPDVVARARASVEQKPAKTLANPEYDLEN